MCMVIVSDSRFKKAEEDIVVYKYMKKKTSLFGLITGYETPYRKTFVPFLREGSVLKAKGKVDIQKMHSVGYVEEGVIHAYKNKPHFNDSPLICFECIIPKGTDYIEGCLRGEIGAKKIVFVKPLN